MTAKPCLNTSGRSKMVPESTALSLCTSKGFMGVTHQKCRGQDSGRGDKQHQEYGMLRIYRNCQESRVCG